MSPLHQDARMTQAVEEALKGREDLDVYKENKRLLFAVQLELKVPDITDLAAESLTGGGDDKSADLIHLDRDRGLVLIAQAYEAKEGSNKSEAPVHKAASLHQAVSWVLSHAEDKLPEGLAPRTREVREALEGNLIREIWVWYFHNLPESVNVRQEMEAVERRVVDAVKANYPELQLDIRVAEIGRETLAAWYESSRTPILVHEPITVPVEDTCLTVQGPGWTAYTVTVTAEWVSQIYWAHRDDLFSANVRGFLGYRKSKSAINNGIRETLTTEPGNFWIFNNGITALVDSASYDDTAKELSVQGLSIVNGAQTTGAIGDFGDDQSKAEARIVMRFIKCPDRAVVERIIRYNNRQNVIDPADFRSNDRVQRRLVSEFSELGIVGYTGGRRGEAVSGPRKAVGEVDTESASRALAAYHGAPGIAYGERRLIWEDDRLYQRLFSTDTSAQHVLFCWSLIKALEEYKLWLFGLESRLPAGKKAQREYFERSGSIHLLAAGIAECMEDILGRHIPNSFQPRFSGKQAPGSCVQAWRPVVELVAPMAHKHLMPVLKVSGPPRRVSKGELENFRSQVESSLGNGDERWHAFAEKVALS